MNKNIKNKNKNRAFTLAEVLITLAIIGVVAALTIPTVVRNYTEKQTLTQLKKVYTTLSNATNLIIAENGAPENWVKDVTGLYNLYKPKLKTVKACANGVKGCMKKAPYPYLKGFGTCTNWDGQGNNLVLADGAIVHIFNSITPACNINNFTASGTNNACAHFYVDINGDKEPNKIGRDVFAFVITKKGFMPSGCDYPSRCSKAYSGYACACKVLKEDKISY